MYTIAVSSQRSSTKSTLPHTHTHKLTFTLISTPKINICAHLAIARRGALAGGGVMNWWGFPNIWVNNTEFLEKHFVAQHNVTTE